jgi:hypothetical protein
MATIPLTNQDREKIEEALRCFIETEKITVQYKLDLYEFDPDLEPRSDLEKARVCWPCGGGRMCCSP